MVEYVTSGPWGSGTGSPLPATVVDENFWELVERVVDLETSPPDAVSIASIALDGLALVFTLTDSTVLDPIPLPIVMPRWRGEWGALTEYDALDQLSVTGTGVFLVLLDHTSAASFDADAVGAAETAGAFVVGRRYIIATVGTTDFTLIGASANTIGVEFTATGAGSGTGTATPRLYHMLIAVGTVGATLDSLADVDTSGAVSGDVLTYDGAEWAPQAPAQVLDDLNDVDAPSPNAGDVLTWNGASPGAWESQASALPDIASGTVLAYAGSPSPGQAEETAVSDLLTAAFGPTMPGELIRFDGADWVSGAPVTVTTISGTTHTLQAPDGAAWLRFTNASPVTLTIPPNASVAFNIGTVIPFTQAGAGQVTVDPGVGVTVNCADTHNPITNGEAAVAGITKVGTNEWDLYGNLEPVGSP